MRYFLHLAYDGTSYRGWQWQPNIISVQGILEDALQRIFHTKITVFGCGRTDAGVHASQYFAHINLPQSPDFDLKFRLNKNLPSAIAIYDVLKMTDNQHARYDATARTYDYFIHLYKSPLLDRYSSFYQVERLDFSAMQAAVALFMQYDDFKAICKQPLLYENTICKVTHAKLSIDATEKRLHFTITANRFLRGMIRLTVMFLLKIGTGKMTVAELEHLLRERVMLRGLKSALPNGLHLSEVKYPYLQVPPQNDFCHFLKV